MNCAFSIPTPNFGIVLWNLYLEKKSGKVTFNEHFLSVIHDANYYKSQNYQHMERQIKNTQQVLLIECYRLSWFDKLDSYIKRKTKAKENNNISYWNTCISFYELISQTLLNHIGSHTISSVLRVGIILKIFCTLHLVFDYNKSVIYKRRLDS